MARKANTQAEKRQGGHSGGRDAPGDNDETPFAAPFSALKLPSSPPPKAPEKKKEIFTPPARAKQADRDEAILFCDAMHNTTPLRGAQKITPAKQSVPQSAAPAVSSAPSSGPVATISRTERGGITTDSPQAADDNEEHLFAQAMDGVEPVRARGRDLAPGPGELPQPPSHEKEHLEEMLHGKLEFALEYSEEFIEGRVLGLDPLVMAKLRTGQFSHEGHLDLHGRNVEQAYLSLSHFLKEGYQSGKRHLLLITGRGRNSPGGAPVLRERVQAWLTRDPFKRVVLAFCTAQQRDGGAGAVYLLLRKRKKSQGKIVWDRMPSEEELLM